MGDVSAHVADKACLPMDGPAEATVYEGSGLSAVRGQRLRARRQWIIGRSGCGVVFLRA